MGSFIGGTRGKVEGRKHAWDLAKDISKSRVKGATCCLLAAYSETQEVVGKWQQFSSERDGASWGDLSQCLETFLVVRPGEVATGI